MKYRTMLLFLLFLSTWCGSTDAELDTLEKIRARDWDGRYDLALMGEGAAPLLVQVLTDENEDARSQAHYLLDRYYADPSILPALTCLFLDSTDKSIRSNAIHLIASVDAEYARKLITLHINDTEIQDIVVSVLSILKDERVIPLLGERLKDSKKRIQAAFALADFKDKRAVPILLEVLDDPKTQSWKREQVIEKLAHIGDVLTLPVLLNLLDKQSNLSFRIKPALSQSEPSFIEELLKSELLLERIEGPGYVGSSAIRQTLLDIIGNQKNPKIGPHYEKVYLDIDDFQLNEAIAIALGNMGEKGFESLLKLVRQKPNSKVIEILATYNSAEAFDMITSLALDKTFPLRKDAIWAFLRYSSLRSTEVSKYVLKILHDVDPKQKLAIIGTLPRLGNSWKGVMFKHLTQLLTISDPEIIMRTISLIGQMNLTVMAPALKKLIQTTKGNTSDAAHMVYDLLQDKTQIELNIELDHERYDYEQPISLTYRITNDSDHPIYIALFKSLDSGYVSVKIQRPDGTMGKYRGPTAYYAGLTYDDIETLQPGDEITGTIHISDYYDLSQPGVYTVQLQISPGLRGIISKEHYSVSEGKIVCTKQAASSRLTWSNPLVSSKDLFQINPPTIKIFNQMIESIDPDVITEENRNDIVKTCYQLAKIGKPEGIAAIKKLALMGTISEHDFRNKIKLSALHRLYKYPDSELVGGWIDTLNIGHKFHSRHKFHSHIKALGASGDARAIEPLRQMTFRLNSSNDSTRAALALQKLGDENGVNWLRKVAFRKLRHWKEDERQSGTRILALLNSPDKHIDYPLYSLRNPWFYAQNYDQSIDWSIVHEKSATPDGLTELLQHKNPIIQRSAAYELAYLGDKTGILMIQQDLYANDSATRVHARNTLSKLQQKVSTVPKN